MWREQIKALLPEARFHAAADYSSVAGVEAALVIRLPAELTGLLQESDGIGDKYGFEMVWPCARIEDDNLSFRRSSDFRTLYMPFDNLLFFGDAGNGDQFAYSILDGEIRRSDVFVWDHENDSRTWVAPSLAMYLDWWITGKIKL